MHRCISKWNYGSTIYLWHPKTLKWIFILPRCNYWIDFRSTSFSEELSNYQTDFFGLSLVHVAKALNSKKMIEKRKYSCDRQCNQFLICSKRDGYSFCSWSLEFFLYNDQNCWYFLTNEKCKPWRRKPWRKPIIWLNKEYFLSLRNFPENTFSWEQGLTGGKMVGVWLADLFTSPSRNLRSSIFPSTSKEPSLPEKWLPFGPFFSMRPLSMPNASSLSSLVHHRFIKACEK